MCYQSTIATKNPHGENSGCQVASRLLLPLGQGPSHGMHRPPSEKKFTGQRSKQLPLSSNRSSGGRGEGERRGREERERGEGERRGREGGREERDRGSNTAMNMHSKAGNAAVTISLCLLYTICWEIPSLWEVLLHTQEALQD